MYRGKEEGKCFQPATKCSVMHRAASTMDDPAPNITLLKLRNPRLETLSFRFFLVGAKFMFPSDFLRDDGLYLP